MEVFINIHKLLDHEKHCTLTQIVARAPAFGAGGESCMRLSPASEFEVACGLELCTEKKGVCAEKEGVGRVKRVLSVPPTLPM